MSAYVFFDLDGTLWDRDFVIPEDAAAAVRRLQEAGGRAFLCTGRSRANTHYPQLAALHLDGMVCACGCHIEAAGKILYERLLPDPTVDLLLGITAEYDIPIVYEGPEYEWFDPAHAEGRWNMAARWDGLGERAKFVSDLQAPYRINKATVAAKQDAAAALLDDLSGKASFIRHPYGFEIVPYGASKMDGIRRVQQIYQVPDEDIYAFGDGANDMEMIQGAAHGVAMGAAIQTLKDAAEYVTTDLHEGGVRNALVHYGLI